MSDTKMLKIPTVITTSEAAERLGVSRRRVQQLVAERRIEAIRMGRDLWISAASLKLFATLARPVGNPTFGANGKRKKRRG